MLWENFAGDLSEKRVYMHMVSSSTPSLPPSLPPSHLSPTSPPQNEMINLVAQLEALGSGRSVDAEDVEGVWELVYTDVEPFRTSPFFQTVGKVMGGTTLSAEDFFRLHRLATRGSEIGKVRREKREGRKEETKM